jgi:hypothetical protein
VARLAVWHGTEAQLLALLDAVQRNCHCARAACDTSGTRCEAHMMLAFDQRALDGLLFARWMAQGLRAQESHVVPTLSGA